MLTLLNEVRSLPVLTLSVRAFMVPVQYVTTVPLYFCQEYMGQSSLL